jgi:hypothetical protein
MVENGGILRRPGILLGRELDDVEIRNIAQKSHELKAQAAAARRIDEQEERGGEKRCDDLRCAGIHFET